jgi:formamidopyrimidine-DNA glycosylase
VLIWHLGMSGRVLIYTDTHLNAAPPEQTHDHVIFRTESNAVVRFNDTRRFGFMDLVDVGGLDAHPMIARIGPEPLKEAFDAHALADRLKGKRAPIKAALLDQRVVAGLGNIYVSESLFRAGISPRRSSHTIQGKRAERLISAIKDILANAIVAGGSSLRDHRQTNGDLGYFQHQFAVYGKAGETCPNLGCSAKIQQIVQSGRSTYFCPRCQR